MKNYTITVNGNVYDVTVEENTNGAPAAAPAPRAAAPAPAPAAKPAAAGAAGSISITAGAAGKVVDVVMDKDTFEVTDLVIKKTGIADQIKAGGENVVPSELVKVIGDKILLKSDDDI